MSIAVISDVQQNKKEQPPNYKEYVGIEDKECAMCSECASYDEDKYYHCFKFHRNVNECGGCDAWKE